jgi:major membrane immunogen (membrane-anchored lipoprotein)
MKMKLLGGGVAMVAAALLFSACAGQQIAPDPARIRQNVAASKMAEIDLVRATVAEPERAERFVELLATRDRLLDRVALEVAAHRERVVALNADYAAERGEFDALLADYNRRRAVAQAELLDLIAEMKRTSTADEWEKIADFQLERLNPRDLAYRKLAGG